MDFSGINGVFSGEQISPTDRLKIAIVGAPNAGKSILTSTAPKPLYVFDFDDKRESYKGKAGVSVKTYRDLQDVDADIGIFEYNKSRGMEIPITYALDSMTFMVETTMKYYFKYSADGRKDFTLGSFKISIARGYDGYAAENELVEQILYRLFALGNVIACFHEVDEEDVNSTDKNPIYTGRKIVHPPRLNKYLSLFNEKWRIDVDSSGQRKVQLKADYRFNGGTLLELDNVEEPNIENMLAKHQQRYQQKQ